MFAGLELVLSYTEKSCFVLYCRQFSMNNKMNKTGIYLVIFQIIFSGKKSSLLYDAINNQPHRIFEVLPIREWVSKLLCQYNDHLANIVISILFVSEGER